MADKIVRSRNHVWRINTSFHNILGQGAFGIVYKTWNENEETFAVKRIDGERHPRVLSQNFNKLLQLDHENIVKIFDICQEDQVLFMFMTYCPLGDLNRYFLSRSNELTLREKIDIMEQVANGIVYLHSRNVVHRDIKPDNILVFCDFKVIAKLSDFDLSKVLDPDVETSVMTTNMGTFAFKAPEFFQRTKDEHIYYHRNVDVFAAGLTYLAMIQCDKYPGKLIPHIETPKDESEVHAPIGSLIGERIKYQVSDLNVVVIEDTENRETGVKQLIHRMTHYKPEERPSAVDVFQSLQIILCNFDARPEDLDERTLQPTFGPKHQITEGTVSLLEHLPTSLQSGAQTDITQMDAELENIREETINKYPTSKTEHQIRILKATTTSFVTWHAIVQSGTRAEDTNKEITENSKSLGCSTTEQWSWLKKVFTLDLRADVSVMRLRGTCELVTRGKGNKRLRVTKEYPGKRKYIRIVERSTGQEVRELMSNCTHESCSIDVTPWNTDYIVEACKECNVIRTYNINYPFLRYAFRGSHTDVMCCAPDGSLFLLDKAGQLLTFTWNTEKEQFNSKNQTNTCLQNTFVICYLKKYNFLIRVSCDDQDNKGKRIEALNLHDNCKVWQFEGCVDGKKVAPNTICCDEEGQLFVGDDANIRVLLLDGGKGELLRVFKHDNEISSVWNVCWNDASQQLTVLDGFAGRIHGFNITES